MKSIKNTIDVILAYGWAIALEWKPAGRNYLLVASKDGRRIESQSNHLEQALSILRTAVELTEQEKPA